MVKVVPVVFSFDDNYALPASIAIQSLIDTANKGTRYEIYVLYKKISSRVMSKFDSIAPIHWIKVDKKVFRKAPRHKEYPEVVYYRLLIHDLLPQYDKIIWSDVDVLFRRDLSEVYDLDLTGYYWAGVPAECNKRKVVPCCRLMRGEKKQTCMSGHTRFKENQNEHIFMSGFMVINAQKMREDNMTTRFFETIEKFKKHLVMFDLEILNIACDKIKRLPFDYCVLENVFDEEEACDAPEYPFLRYVYSDEELLKAKKTPAIIHYTGKNVRIWNRCYRKIPLYYRIYLINSPFYNKEKYFPIKVRFWRCCLFVRKIFIPKIKRFFKKLFRRN